MCAISNICGIEIFCDLLQYYGHRAKLQVAERESDLERLNRKALQLAREVADSTGTLMAGNICNTTVWNPDDPKAKDLVVEIFKVKSLPVGTNNCS